MGSRGASWRNYVLLLAMNVVIVSLCGMWIMYFPLYASEYLGLSPELIGLIYSLSAASPVAGSVIGGLVADIVGKRRAIAIGFAIAMASLTAMLTQSVTLVSAGFVAYFFGIAFLSPAVSVLVIESSPREARGTLFMLARKVAPSLPPLITLPIAGYLYENDMYVANILAGIAGISIGLALTCFIKEVGGSARRDLWLALRWLANLVSKDRVFAVFLLTFGLNYLFIEGLEWYVPIYLRRIGFSAIEYGLTMGLASLAIAVGALASGGIVDKLGPRTACIIGWLSTSITSIAFVTAPSLALAMLFAWKVVGQIPEAAPPIVIARRYPEGKAIALSTFNAVTKLASIAGPVIIGFVSTYQPAAPFVLRATLLALSSILIYATRI